MFCNRYFSVYDDEVKSNMKQATEQGLESNWYQHSLWASSECIQEQTPGQFSSRFWIDGQFLFQNWLFIITKIGIDKFWIEFWSWKDSKR